MKNIVIGQYVPGDGFLYRLDPRTKLIAVIILMVAVFLLETIIELVVAFGLVILLLIAGKISIVRVAKGLKPLFVLLLFTFFFQILFNKEGTLLVEEILSLNPANLGLGLLLTVLWRLLARFGKFKTILLFLWIAGIYCLLRYVAIAPQWTTFSLQIHEKGIEMSVFVVIRLLIIISLSTIMTLTTKPTDLTQGLEKLMRPLKVIGIKSDDFALIISISLRYIPTILDEANKIMAAQASRGADFSEGGLKEKIKQVISLLVPMFIIAFKRSEELADAMESRNFVPGKKRTRIHELSFGWKDAVTSVVILLCLAASITLKVIG
ncbi:MAG: energy-coupling factor transporter transmembrane component T [Candidatus Izemoplasmatales bacterium]|jgi:energy-coupling factor transport system permease protein|nr:energy-coupling factor transporter transmembrane component T [Candidatus Izemoplasmatales bacterium]MDD4355219.1 energy-coupling factor transporter transmembrane component T [Candidatus Izemoplasmatales bacterium]MDD4987865.1 energy-coupling factor transporter transmembrane component T [Candidatus Izemoplasmatales bacterium]NLF48980.1 energy-coupling factor transporter transmembrane protein EcfT [Acholeplasmataceae bacterium]